MLKLKPNCECCDLDLAPASPEARICSFECTFCQECADTHFNGVCPNCRGEFVKRPVRPADALAKYPASNERFINEKHSGLPGYKRHSRNG